MHYVTRRSHQMQNQKFGVMCPSAIFVKSKQVPPVQEKSCIGISHPGRTGMHYVTRISHRMQKHKFSVMSPDTFYVESEPVPPQHEKQCVVVSWPG
jgi:hypothetical protein